MNIDNTTITRKQNINSVRYILSWSDATAHANVFNRLYPRTISSVIKMSVKLSVFALLTAKRSLDLCRDDDCPTSW